MRIAPAKRVMYENNPLAEVVCQIRFLQDDPSYEAKLEECLPKALSSRFARRFVEDITEVRVTLGAPPEHDTGPQGVSRLHHFVDDSGAWRATICGEFLALTSTRYLEWADFRERLLFLSDAIAPLLTAAKTTRIGLRYKDVIARHDLGLAQTPWTELLAPYLLGPFWASDVFGGGAVDEGAIEGHVFQSTLRLDDCKLLLQGGLMKSTDGHATAFLVDADFFVEGDDIPQVLQSANALDAQLAPLRANAGNLFRRSIKVKLHDALKPT